MINKFQQGGKQLEALMLFVQGLAQILKADPKLIIQIVQLNPKALEAAVQTYQQTQDMNQAAQAFQSQIQSAKHGAKLQYIKSLKHQCADDEEVVYYKKGGSVGCGCRKKLETGGKTEQSPIEKFKAIRKAQLGDTLAEREKQLNRNKTNEGTPPHINKGIGKNCKGAKFFKKGDEMNKKKDSVIEKFKNRKK